MLLVQFGFWLFRLTEPSLIGPKYLRAAAMEKSCAKFDNNIAKNKDNGREEG